VFAQPTAAALNHLLTQSGWALQRLARFSGKTARFNIAPFSFACTFQYDSTLRSYITQLEQRINQLSSSPQTALLP